MAFLGLILIRSDRNQGEKKIAVICSKNEKNLQAIYCVYNFKVLDLNFSIFCFFTLRLHYIYLIILVCSYFADSDYAGFQAMLPIRHC